MSNIPSAGSRRGLQEAEIVSWHVGVGDHVVADQPLVSVETAKAVVEVPSPWAGRIAGSTVSPATCVKVGAPLVEFERRARRTAMPAPSSATLPHGRAGRAGAAESSRRASGSRGRSPAVRKRAAELGVDLADRQAPARAARSRAPMSRRSGARNVDADGYEPLRGVRRAMAET